MTGINGVKSDIVVIIVGMFFRIISESLRMKKLLGQSGLIINKPMPR